MANLDSFDIAGAVHVPAALETLGMTADVRQFAASTISFPTLLVWSLKLSNWVPAKSLGCKKKNRPKLATTSTRRSRGAQTRHGEENPSTLTRSNGLTFFAWGFVWRLLTTVLIQVSYHDDLSTNNLNFSGVLLISTDCMSWTVPRAFSWEIERGTCTGSKACRHSAGKSLRLSWQ